MTWKEILKLSPEDRKKFTELGDKYAPDDMEGFRLDRRMFSSAKNIKQDRKKYEDIKEKIESKKDKIMEKEPGVYEAMQTTLELMEKSIGTEDFMLYRSALINLSKGHNIFSRGSP